MRTSTARPRSTDSRGQTGGFCSSAEAEDIIIVGGGIGGLTTALGLIQNGFDVRVYEQAPVLREVGAGLTLSSGAMASLDMLGLTDALEERIARTNGFPFLHYRTGALLAGQMADPAAPASDTRRGAAGHMFRADLHGLLAEQIRALDPDAIVLDRRLVTFGQDERGVTAHFQDGSIAQADLLIGADGVRSAVRGDVLGEEEPVFTGRIAFRFLIPADVSRPYLTSAGNAAAFIGPGKTFNRYLIAGGTILNCVALSKSDRWSAEGWSHRASVSELLDEFPGWHPDVVALMERAPPQDLIRWGIFHRAPQTHWSKGRVMLMGDAAHPMLPFLGLGAAMAIEDGVILARALSECDGFEQAFARFEAARIPRTTKVFEGSVRQGELFDTTDPDHYPPPGAPAHDRSYSHYDPRAISL